MLSSCLHVLMPRVTKIKTHRDLCRLYSVLAELFGENVREYSSTIAKKGAESQALRAFKDGKANILVASDAVSRGMDVPGMDVVINYDSASYAKTYVHRAGRTARAGGKGSVVTLLTTEQVHHFKAMLYKIDNTYVRDYKLPPNSVNEARKETQQALEKAAERLGEEVL